MAGKRSFEEEKQPAAAAAAAASSDKKARLVYSQVASLQWNLVRQFLKEGNVDAAEDLLNGLSERDFATVERVAADDPTSEVASNLLKQHRKTRDEHTEMASFVLETSGVVSSFKNLSRDVMLHQANSFLTDKESNFLSQTNKQTMKDLHEGYKIKGMVNASDYFNDGWERNYAIGFKAPTRFTGVQSIEMIARLPRNTTEIEMSSSFRQHMMGAHFPPRLESLFIGGGYTKSMTGVVFPSSLKRLHLDLSYVLSIENVEIPEGLEELHISGSFNDRLTKAVFPASLKCLSLSGAFNNPLVGVRLPPNLEKLHLMGRYNMSLVGVVFPESLVELKLGDDFNQSLEGVTFPDSLRVLMFGRIFNRELVGLPPHLESLTLGGTFNRTLSGVLPPMLKRLEMRYVWGGNTFEGVEFPVGMLLVVPGKSIQY